MIIIGCDYHPGVQQIAFVDTETGEFQETRLQHREQAEQYYRELALRGVQVRLGMEASGQARWFERLLAELKMELWIGDAAEIRAQRVRKKKTDREVRRGGGGKVESALCFPSVASFPLPSCCHLQRRMPVISTAG